jgi:hypothetical protein
VFSCNKPEKDTNMWNNIMYIDNSKYIPEVYCEIISEYIKINHISFDEFIYLQVFKNKPNYLRLYAGGFIPSKEFFNAQGFFIIDYHIVICDFDIPIFKKYDISFIDKMRRIGIRDYPWWLIENNNGVAKIHK